MDDHTDKLRTFLRGTFLLVLVVNCAGAATLTFGAGDRIQAAIGAQVLSA